MELATGEFPYKNCRNDFEMLAKILDEDPPLLPLGHGFSMDFCNFVCRWCVEFLMILAGVSLLNVSLSLSLVFLFGVLFACFLWFFYTIIISVELVTIGGQHCHIVIILYCSSVYFGNK